MRFGLFLPQGWRFDLVGIDESQHWPTISNLARRVDGQDLWESVWVYDHFHTTPVPSEEATHEAWSLMAALAASTDRVRLGQMCTCMAYRNPMYLAKVAATVDHISGGRLEMGIGAGWYEHEWRAYGYGFPRAGVRLKMLEEGVQIFQQAWRDGVATFHGEHYDVDGAICRPLPLQPGGVPLWIAGGGEKVTLRIAAEHARYTNFDGTLEGFTRKSALLREHCEAVGADFDQITRTSNYNVMLGASEAEVAQKFEAHAARLSSHMDSDKVEKQLRGFRDMPAFGTPEQVVEKLTALREQGLAYGIFYFPDAAYTTETIALFEREVMPALAG
ncbi:LLM class F420-dependent oxidoreductase [Georgenia subflava]|uniref:TIGR03560 family F420-dependent LLM class oxidoreductase n=1 Tax=Georgenia subflava TaxID=1622177 RepID=A0A6N7EF54_9MICO|nr:LLM class F420-dependent oxidoreductase [Georgenia subflava]MPV36739.1 TIGR03560 family F420-dependent LLM class oxidoreductase [Georgenia subflava]